MNVDSPSTTCPIAALTTSSKRDMCAPFWAAPRSTTHSKRAENSCSAPFCSSRMTFSTSVTPTRERLIGTLGRCDWTSIVGDAAVGSGVMMRQRVERRELGRGEGRWTKLGIVVSLGCSTWEK